MYNEILNKDSSLDNSDVTKEILEDNEKFIEYKSQDSQQLFLENSDELNESENLYDKNSNWNNIDEINSGGTETKLEKKMDEIIEWSKEISVEDSKQYSQSIPLENSHGTTKNDDANIDDKIESSKTEITKAELNELNKLVEDDQHQKPKLRRESNVLKENQAKDGDFIIFIEDDPSTTQVQKSLLTDKATVNNEIDKPTNQSEIVVCESVESEEITVPMNMMLDDSPVLATTTTTTEINSGSKEYIVCDDVDVSEEETIQNSTVLTTEIIASTTDSISTTISEASTESIPATVIDTTELVTSTETVPRTESIPTTESISTTESILTTESVITIESVVTNESIPATDSIPTTEEETTNILSLQKSEMLPLKLRKNENQEKVNTHLDIINKIQSLLKTSSDILNELNEKAVFSSSFPAGRHMFVGSHVNIFVDGKLTQMN